MTPAEILRNRCRAVGVDMNVDQATGAIQALRNHGYKLVSRDCGESREVALEFGPLKDDGSRDVKICSDEPSVIWAKIWDEHA